MRNWRILYGLVLMVPVIGSAAWADKLVLKDGTTLQGHVIKQAEQYWIKLPDGTSKFIPFSNVTSFVAEDGSNASGNSGSAAAFADAKNRADRVLMAIQAQAIWQEFVDKYPNSSEAKDAREQLAQWKSRADDDAEKINGKWIGGDERKKIVQEANRLTIEGMDMFLGENKQTLKAAEKLQEAIKLYPNDFAALFILGDIAMFQDKYDDAVSFYQRATNVDPERAEAFNNMGVANMFARHVDTAIQNFYHSCQVRDSKESAQNLVTALSRAPNIRTAPRNKDILNAAMLLANKYDIRGPSELVVAVIPKPVEHESENRVVLKWGGTGFFISSDGLILTNHHVVTGQEDIHARLDPKIKTSLLVTMDDHSQASAELIAADNDDDLALIRIRGARKTSFLKLSKADAPNEGSECTVMGFPLSTLIGSSVKTTRGIISSNSFPAENGATILTDAKVNPGNSGGPILDKYGNVAAIVAMKTWSSISEDSYGIGINTQHIRSFLKKNHVDTTVGDNAGILDTEGVVVKVKPAVVYIIGTRTGGTGESD